MRRLRNLVVFEPVDDCFCVDGFTVVELGPVLIEKKLCASRRDIKRHLESGSVLRFFPKLGTATFDVMVIDLADVVAGQRFALVPGDIVMLGKNVLTSFIFDELRQSA